MRSPLRDHRGLGRRGGYEVMSQANFVILISLGHGSASTRLPSVPGAWCLSVGTLTDWLAQTGKNIPFTPHLYMIVQLH